MKRYVFDRLIYALVILFLISIFIFILIRLLPGDPIQAASMFTMDMADKEVVHDLQEQYGLNKPIAFQYANWLTDFFKGEWGVSFGTGEDVFEMFQRRLPVTLELFAGSVLWTFLIGFPFGILAALKRNTWVDASLTTSAIIGVSIPVFWEAIVMIYLFAVIVHIFPPSGYVPFDENPMQNLLSVAMPSFVMGTQGAGLLIRHVRSSFLEVMQQSYIRTARAKGMSELRILMVHALKPALIPVVTVIGLQWGYVVAGSFLIEYMFAIPGLGRMGVDAIFSRDFPVIQATLILVAINILLINLVVDLIYGYLDPRIRINGRSA